jgi:hypothetical protein
MNQMFPHCLRYALSSWTTWQQNWYNSSNTIQREVHDEFQRVAHFPFWADILKHLLTNVQV